MSIVVKRLWRNDTRHEKNDNISKMTQPNGHFVVLLNKEKVKTFLDFYEPFKSEPPNSNIVMFAKNDGVAVSLYKENKDGISKALFQGPLALNEAKIWDSSLLEEKEPSPFAPPKKELRLFVGYPQIGSDEVGTGDFFGPIEVCAAYVERNDLPEIKELGITDSKKMSDDRILELGPHLIKRFKYSHLSLDNEKYNEVNKTNNMNMIKAKMHNACLLKLSKRYPSASLYQDQFAEERLYYKYLMGEKEICKNITFKTKGESLFPSVALASVIARYSFLKKMEKMSDKYDFSFPFGASEAVNEKAIEFIGRYGLDELRKVAKTNFKNYDSIIISSNKDGE